MLARLRSKINDPSKNEKGKCVGGMVNVNEEYLGALRTKSYADYFTKAQCLVNQLPSSLNHQTQLLSEVLLEPHQDTIKPLVESLLSRKSSDDLKTVLFHYFDISAEASQICSSLLTSTNLLQSNHLIVNQMLHSIDHQPSSNSSSHHLNSIVSEIRSFLFHHDPFSDIQKQDFRLINDKHTSFLQNLKSKRKRVARKIKLINCFNKASGICVTAACGLVAIAAVVLAAHTLTALVLGPALFSLPIKPWKKKVLSIGLFKCGFLRIIGQQLDVAAKGTYILNREFDTMSRLVTRLHDEMEHNKEMIQYCFARKEDKFSLQILRELKKSDFGFGKQVEELQEHLYLCLVTINRARALVVEEITK